MDGFPVIITIVPGRSMFPDRIEEHFRDQEAPQPPICINTMQETEPMLLADRLLFCQQRCCSVPCTGRPRCGPNHQHSKSRPGSHHSHSVTPEQLCHHSPRGVIVIKKCTARPTWSTAYPRLACAPHQAHTTKAANTATPSMYGVVVGINAHRSPSPPGKASRSTHRPSRHIL